MKLLFFVTIVLSYAVLSGQTLSIGSGVYFEHYKPIRDKSDFHPTTEYVIGNFQGASLSYNFERNRKYFKKISFFANAYPVITGNDAARYKMGLFFLYTDVHRIAPEIGAVSYFAALKKTKHKIDFGIGIATRYMFQSVPEGIFLLISPKARYQSNHHQKSHLAFTIPLEFRYTFDFTQQLGIYFSAKRSIGLINFIEKQISYTIYDSESNVVENGNPVMMSRGGRSMIELGLVFNLKRVE